MVPTIETARLRLRALSEDDLQAWSAVTADPEVVRHIGGDPLSREETWRRIMATMGAWAMLGYGYWAVEEKGGGRMIGHVGFADFKRDISPSVEGLPEIGWIFAPEAQGKGYATEAVAAALAWAETHLPAERYCCIIVPENAASIRVAEKSGFGERVEGRYRGNPTLIFYRSSSSGLRRSDT